MNIEGIPSYPEELARLYDRRRWWLGITLGGMLDKTVDVYPEKEALVAEGLRLTYSELRERVNRVALALRRIGIGRDQRVILQLPNWPEFVYVYFGLHKIGAIPVLCLPRYAGREVAYFCRKTEAVAWIVPTRYRKTDYGALIRDIRGEAPFLRHILTVRGKGPEGSVPFESVIGETSIDGEGLAFLEEEGPDPRDICHLMPTGGSTGFPKLVPRTHNDFICNIEYRGRAWERGPSDITLIATPLTHNMAIEVSLCPSIFFGGKAVLLSSTDPVDILKAMDKEKVTTTILAVAQLRGILNDPDLERYDLGSLKSIATGGSYIPPELIRKVYDRMGCRFFNVFGMSEGPCAMTRLGDPEEIVLYTVGRPICPYDEFKVLDSQGRELPRGLSGELVARGPGVFRGYFRDEHKNKEEFTEDGFFKTGDMAKIDATGNIVITGRKKDIIIRGGENISANEVEQLVASHPDVEEVVAVGMPDEALGERVCVYVVPAAGRSVSLDSILEHLRQKEVSVLYFPERLEIIESIPLTKVGKVDKNSLRQDIARKLASEREAKEN